ncbi:serine protease [Streptomyces sp. HNM0574]|uniref:S1 family peptidase n=1 Tax=Streptomyces sp. HNM0574 TaxID=2714954 RepID=UPI00146BF249|nr:serine protease [Streptomyces sp. HNM0574]NLU66652.1 trypsin-like peptidase domain-containing protein [Streptomyces sp. HNM0574]
MNRPLVGTLAGALFGAAALAGIAGGPAVAQEAGGQAEFGSIARAGQAPQQGPAQQAAPDFAGTVALSNCSGSLVRMPDSKPGDPGLVLSNGHCLEEGMPKPDQVITDQPSSRGFTLLDAKGGEAAQLKATKLAYATMTDTDVSLYELDSTYEEIEKESGIAPLDVQAEHPEKGKAITVVSGYWKETFSCSLDGFVPELREADWTMKDSLRYTADCKTKGGTSGSPVVDDASGKVVGVNNTRNEDGAECTMNNPCEVDKDGKVTVRHGIAYGQQTYTLTQCVGEGNKVDLSLPDCALPKP